MTLTTSHLLASTAVLLAFCCVGCWTKITSETLARQWLQEYDSRARKLSYVASVAEWNYVTNLTEHNQKLTVEAILRLSEFKKEVAHNTTYFDWKSLEDAALKRQFRSLSHAGVAILSPEEVKRVDTLRTGMEEIYSTAKVCLPGNKNCLNLEPDLTRMFSHSSNWEELSRAWKGWRDVTGRKMKRDYEEHVKLKNKAAKLDGYRDEGDRWRAVYEMDNFEEELERMWQQVKPLYQNLHAYVRRRLAEKYAGHAFPSSGHIPAHIMGNMWAQGWGSIFNVVAPYKGKENLDVTDAMMRQGYNVTQMFRLAEQFFKDLGLPEMTTSFWTESLFTKPTDGRRVVCHAAAWDFLDHNDFRIKMCTDLTMEDLVTIHHEMGHTEYQMLYKDQPLPFRDGANPGFHEAVGDVMALSVSTPQHLYKIGLLDNVTDDREVDINFLMTQGLSKVGFLPFGYLIDQWRWSVFKGDTPPEDYNNKWWQLRCKYQGVSPPVTRHDDDFDPGAKYHIPADVPYIRYFISYVIQFQFHRALCKEAGFQGPLHRCDIGGSTGAGTKLRNMLSMGSSKPWPEAMELLTGQRAMDAGALMEYFQPLTDWLKEQNKGHPVGWQDACPDGTVVRGGAAREDTVALVLMLLAVFSLLLWEM
ncbi:Angiotensin-converting enzyme [Lamellibrachia satsuma]|nr:Angiotensin-converting enzyme [Lamellibrachia satsuma]